MLDGRAVLLIRNPFEVAVSSFTHLALDTSTVRTFAFLGRALNCTRVAIQ